MSGFLNNLAGIMRNIIDKSSGALNQLLPPEQRATILSNLQQFAVNNPKLAGFLTAQIMLTGLPLLLFITFTITVFLFSLIVVLFIGVLAAILFTVFMVLCALVVVLPIVFFTTFAATFFFVWGLGGYYILQWFNKGDAPAEPGSVMGDKLNDWTGGRMGWLMDESWRKHTEKIMVNDTRSEHGGGAKINESEAGMGVKKETHFSGEPE